MATCEEPCVDRVQTELEKRLNQLRALRSRLENHAGSIEDVLERLRGGTPISEVQKEGLTPAIGSLGDLKGVVDAIEQLTDRLEAAGTELEQLV